MLKFAIIGAPRAATSSLYNWLNLHPALQGSSPKEPFYFMDPDHPLAGKFGRTIHTHGHRGYNFFFPDQKSSAYRFEATTHSFYQQTALQSFSAMEPRPIVFLLLRQPAHRLRSSFYYTQNSICKISKKLSFSLYVESVLNNKMSFIKDYYKDRSTFEMGCMDIELGKYIKWIEPWDKYLNRDNLNVLFFDEIAVNPNKTLQYICKKLNVDYSIYNKIDLKIYNKSFDVKSDFLHDLALFFIRKQLNFFRILKKQYKRIQYKDNIKKSFDEAALAELDNYYCSWNMHLAKYLKMDLSHWSET